MLKALDTRTWDYAKAAHLLNRAGFGGVPDQIEQLHKAGLNAAVDQIMNGADDSAAFPAPDWAKPRNMQAFRQEMQALDPEARKARQKQENQITRQRMLELIGWWLIRMRQTPDPFREKLTLFWHGHFATSIQKVRDPYMMWRQNETLRENSLGNFGTMVKEISRDPAMMVWLDTRLSQKQHPNENFA